LTSAVLFPTNALVFWTIQGRLGPARGTCRRGFRNPRNNPSSPPSPTGGWQVPRQRPRPPAARFRSVEIPPPPRIRVGPWSRPKSVWLCLVGDGRPRSPFSPPHTKKRGRSFFLRPACGSPPPCPPGRAPPRSAVFPQGFFFFFGGGDPKNQGEPRNVVPPRTHVGPLGFPGKTNPKYRGKAGDPEEGGFFSRKYFGCLDRPNFDLKRLPKKKNVRRLAKAKVGGLFIQRLDILADPLPGPGKAGGSKRKNQPGVRQRFFSCLPTARAWGQVPSTEGVPPPRIRPRSRGSVSESRPPFPCPVPA